MRSTTRAEFSFWKISVEAVWLFLVNLEVKMAQIASELSNLTLPNSTGETQQGMRGKTPKPKEGAHTVTTQEKEKRKKKKQLGHK